MIGNKIDGMIASAMKNHESDLLRVLKLIKCEFVKSEKDNVEVTDAVEVKILSKMVAQREDAIKQYKEGGREDLASIEQTEMEIINSFLPKQASEEEINEFTRKAILAYEVSQEDGYVLSMKDMKPILTIVQKEYPTVNGKIVSQILNNIIKKN